MFSLHIFLQKHTGLQMQVPYLNHFDFYVCVFWVNHVPFEWASPLLNPCSVADGAGMQ